ncbi:ARM repeat-containing protein [Nadsonia fulvescens var. elongata DSM 6958]|uniref:ARM repeat-containing protein n=1 Tax=Nadsonia fulvescens var. elongata DSM 6958 TaxID=857566 RepID=A0A1E3PN45_9ASCO|nr:ARM repeat-containing protein [Nadsonia fulvescens var. elongata DSM 6958]
MGPPFSSSVVSTLPASKSTHTVGEPYKVNLSKNQSTIDKIGTPDIWAPLFYNRRASTSTSSVESPANLHANANIVSFSTCNNPSECSRTISNNPDFNAHVHVPAPRFDSFVPRAQQGSFSISTQDSWIRNHNSRRMSHKDLREFPYSPPQSRNGSIDENYSNPHFVSQGQFSNNVHVLPPKPIEYHHYQAQNQFQPQNMNGNMTQYITSGYDNVPDYGSLPEQIAFKARNERVTQPTRVSPHSFTNGNSLDSKSYYSCKPYHEPFNAPYDIDSSFNGNNDTYGNNFNKMANSYSFIREKDGVAHRENVNSNLVHHRNTSPNVVLTSRTSPQNEKAESVILETREQSFPVVRPNRSSPVSGKPSHGKNITKLESMVNSEKKKSKSLVDFRNSSSKNFEFKDAVGHIVEFSLDQYGSRFIQDQLEMADGEQRAQIFSEIEPYLLSLMTDVFGNYVLQKFFEFGSDNQRYRIASSMEGHVADLSIHTYGCRVVQKAIEYIQRGQQISLIEELTEGILHCLKDQNGNHVIQKAIERMPLYDIRFLFEKFRGHVIDLATHSYGCRVLQKLLEKTTFEHEQGYHYQQFLSSDGKQQFSSSTEPSPYYQADLLSEVLAGAKTLLKNQYGNYVIQHILEKGTREEKQYLIDIIMGSLLYYSKHKFASNVVEKSIHSCTTQQRKCFIAEIITSFNMEKGAPVSNDLHYSSPLSIMIKDQYANYVIQRLLKVCKKVDRKNYELLSSMIKPELQGLRRAYNGKHLSSIEKLV